MTSLGDLAKSTIQPACSSRHIPASWTKYWKKLAIL
jgi:nitrate/TMAO reductase-like tetraheme cytochrome c subunit